EHPVVRCLQPEAVEEIELDARAHPEIRVGVRRSVADGRFGDIDAGRDPRLYRQRRIGNREGEAKPNGKVPGLFGCLSISPDKDVLFAVTDAALQRRREWHQRSTNQLVIASGTPRRERVICTAGIERRDGCRDAELTPTEPAAEAQGVAITGC